MKTLRLPLSVSTASLRSAIDTSSCLARSLTPAAKSLSGVPGVVVHASVLPCSGRFRKGDRRLSQVSREPFRTFALLSDPGRTIALGFWRSGAAPAGIKAKAPAISQYFEAPSHGFCTRCKRLRPPSLTTLQCSLPGGCHLSRADSLVPLGFLQRISTSGYPIVSFLSGFILTLYAGFELELAGAQQASRPNASSRDLPFPCRTQVHTRNDV